MSVDSLATRFPVQVYFPLGGVRVFRQRGKVSPGLRSGHGRNDPSARRLDRPCPAQGPSCARDLRYPPRGVGRAVRSRTVAEWFSALEKAEATGGTGLGSTRTVWVARSPSTRSSSSGTSLVPGASPSLKPRGRSVSSPRRSTSGSTSRFSPTTEFGSPT